MWVETFCVPNRMLSIIANSLRSMLIILFPIIVYIHVFTRLVECSHNHYAR